MAQKGKREAHNSRKLVSSIGVFNSIREGAQFCNQLEGTVASRLRNGFNVDQALGLAPIKVKHPNKGKTIICKNTSFDSITDLADHFEKPFKRVAKRLSAGWTPEEAVEIKPPPPRFRNKDGSVRDHAWTKKQKALGKDTVPVTNKGSYRLYLLKDKEKQKEYVGITTGDLKTRLRGHWNMVKKERSSKLYNSMRKTKKEGRVKDFEITLIRNDAKDFYELQEQEYAEIKARDTIKHGLNTAQGGSLGTPRSIKIGNEIFASHAAAAEFFGIPIANFNQRLTTLGWTPEQAAGLDENKSYGIAVMLEGVQYPSRQSAAKAYGIKPATIHARLHKGWTLEQAFELEKPPSKND